MVEPEFSATDLLYPSASRRVDREQLRQALTFAFATGDVGDTLDKILAQAEVGATRFRPDDFERDIFLADFARRWLKVQVQGHSYRVNQPFLLRLIARPPIDPEAVFLRQRVFSELLERPNLRAAVEDLYRLCARLRDQLATRPIGGRLDPMRRRLDILRSIHDLVGVLSTRFTGAQSALSRLEQFGTLIASAEKYTRLGQLLAYEQGQAELDFRVHMGADGSIRGFDTLAIRDNSHNDFHSAWFVRLWMTLRLMLRGYRCTPGELLNRFVDELFSAFELELIEVLQLTLDLEFYLAGLGFRDAMNRAGLEVCLPEFSQTGERRLRSVFNPLLVEDERTIVPCDVARDRRGITIVTGPNSGGKTRLLQSLALTQLLGQIGFLVPAADACLPWVEGMFVSMIEQASSDQREGRLGTELLRIRRLFESVEPKSLIILDELCSGTNPSEGEEMCRLVLDLLPELDPDVYITTHFLAFAGRLQQALPELQFLQAELDVHEQPTFRFVDGVATTSLAHKTAARLGVTAEALRALVHRKNARVAARAA